MAPWSHAAFSQDLGLLSVCGADGKLKVFDTKSNKLVQEFVPDGHLNGQIRSLCWISAPSQLELQTPKQQSKKRKVVLEDCPDRKLLLLGQSNGSVLLYSSNSAEVVGKLISDSSNSVDALTWAKGNDVFAGLSSGQIVRWTLPNSQSVKSWKSSRNGDQVKVLAVHPTEPWLISASRSITVWDIETQKALKSFLGHESPVRQLLFTPTGDHLASIATNDRNVNVWPLHKLKENKSSSSADPVAMFVLQDYPVQMDVAISSIDGTVKLSAVAEGGSLNIFSETINGKCTKPSKPHLTIQIAQSNLPVDAPIESIPILAARFNSDSLKQILVTYGDTFNLRFENVDITTKKQLIVLERSNPRKASKEKEVSSRIKGDTSEAQYVTPIGTKRPNSSKPVHLPIEDRLKNLSVDKFEENESRIPNGPASDSLSKLLQQGLTSSDHKMQKEIFLKRDPAIISSTVAELPVHCVMAMVQELVVLVHWRGWRGEAATKWLNEVLMQHSSVVLGCPQLMDMIQPILGLVEVRLATHYSMSKLKGRLSMLLSQMTLRGKIKKMSPQQNDVTTFDIEDESESSSDEDNLSLIDSESEAENSDEMEEDDNSDDDEEEGDSDDAEDDGVEQKEEIAEPTVDSRTRKKRKSDTGEENMELEC